MVSTSPLVDKAAAQEREQARLKAELEERERRNRAIEEEKKRQEQVARVVCVVLSLSQEIGLVEDEVITTARGRLVFSGLRRDD